ncbi:MAG: phosphohistidine phosphatase SixA [Bacteroidota bacterium]
MQLYFLRHGEAGHNAPSDFERELTPAGEQSALNIGKFCAGASIHFSHVLTSPLIRTKQTARCVMSSLPDVAFEETEFLTPDSDPRNLLEHLRSFSMDSRILLVTHEPFVSNCISTIISGTEAVNIVMKPATFVFIETSGVPARGNGRLRWVLPPGVIENLL